MKSEGVLLRKLFTFAIVHLVFLAGCGGGTSQSSNNQALPPSGSNPTPTITTISPNSAAAGGAAFTLTINDANFVGASTVNFGGAAPATTFVSATQLSAAIPAAAIASAGTTAVVTVTNPAPGGGTSNAVNFTISSGMNPVPTINRLLPSVTAVGGPAFTLTVSGSNFVSGSVVHWNGSDRPTAFQSSTQVNAQIPAGDIATTGTAAITVFNPPLGGGTSNSLNFSMVTALDPVSVAVAPDPSGKFGKFAYVANLSSSDVSMYTIDTTTGVLKSIGTIAAGTEPDSVAVHPSGKFAYVANFGNEDFGTPPGSVSMYRINADGSLTSTGTIAEATEGFFSVAVDPSGKFAYVANLFSNNVSMYTIDATTGALTSTGKVGEESPGTIAVHPSGKFAYVANLGASNSISMYTIDATTGALTFIGTVAAGLSPESVAVDPSGKFAYTANVVSNSVSMYTINATTGTLTSIGEIAAGLVPNSIAIDPSGKFAYVANNGSDDVSMYSIDAATGVLTLIGTIGT